MLWLIESLALCAAFTLIILPPLFRDPMSQIASYPPQIRERVKALPEYAGVFERRMRGHLARKMIGALVLLPLLFAGIAYFSGMRGFWQAAAYSFTLFMSVSAYDLYVLDLIVFRHSAKLRIPGSEDMDEAYRCPVHHIIGFGKSVFIGAAVSLIAGGLVYCVSLFNA